MSYDGPQNLLTFDSAPTLPVHILTALGTGLRIKSNSIMFEDEEEDSSRMMEVTALYVAILRHLDMGYRNIFNVNDITATGTISTTGAISSNSLTTNTLTTTGISLNIQSNIVRFRGLDNTIYIEGCLGGVQFYDVV